MSKTIPMIYEGKEIRTVIDDKGETLWVAKDVAEILGYANTSDAIKKHCKGVAKRYPLETEGGTQNLRVIHEPDLYRLMTNSQMEGAERFEAWVFEEVLPTIRKTGGYSVAAPKSRTLTKTAADFKALKAIAMIAGLTGNPAILSANQGMIRIHNEDPLDMVGCTHLVTEGQERILTPTDISKQVGAKSGQEVNKLLEALHLQERLLDGHGHPYYKPTENGKKYAVMLDTGKKKNDGTMVQQIKWKECVVQVIKEATA